MTPNPGSDEAIKAGCMCPVIDNGSGAGAFMSSTGAPAFWFDENCPLHGAGESDATVAFHDESSHTLQKTNGQSDGVAMAALDQRATGGPMIRPKSSTLPSHFPSPIPDLCAAIGEEAMARLALKLENNSRTDRRTGCRVWTRSLNRKGYGQLGIPEVRGIIFRAHRVAWELVNGPIPMGVLVCHRCDNRRCIEVSHLFLGTFLDNARDAQLKGRLCRHSRRSSTERAA